jgi:filamentous hemagglutinin
MIGAQTDSGVMTHIKALADIIDVPVELLTQHIEYFRTRKKNGRIQTNTSTAVGSRHTTRGRFVMEAGHNLIAQKTAVEAGQIDMVAGNAVEFQDAHDTVTVQETFTSKGSFGKKKKCQIAEQRQTSFGVTLKADIINVTAVTDAITLTNPTFEAIETNLKAVEGLVSILLGVNTYCFSSMKSSTSSVWNRMGQRTEEHTTYARLHK